MIWVSWRQHRGQAAACLALLAALSVYAVIEGTSMRTAFGGDGLAGSCLARTQGTACEAGISAFMNQFGSAVNIAFYSVLPAHYERLQQLVRTLTWESFPSEAMVSEMRRSAPKASNSWHSGYRSLSPTQRWTSITSTLMWLLSAPVGV